MKNHIKYLTRLMLMLLLFVFIFRVNAYADACGCVDDITDEETLKKSRAAHEKVWGMIDEYTDPEEFLYDPWVYSGPGIYIIEPLTDDQLKVLKSEAERVTANCNTQYDKIEAIFNYVHDRIDYSAGVYTNPYYVWYYKEGSCGNYAALTRTMLVSIGIPCMYLTGCDHAYNAAYDSDAGRWIFIDATNDFFDLNINMRSMKPMWFVYEIEGLFIDGIYYSINTGVEDGKEWYEMEWELYTTGVKNKNSKSYKIHNKICDIPLVEIGKNTFNGCKNVSYISIPYGVKRIGNSAFYNCTSLKKVDFPDTVSELGDYAISATGIEEIDLSDTNISIMGYSIFEDCELLRNVILPDILKEIDENSFSNCPKLKELDFSNTKITKIGRQFSITNNIEKLKFPDSLTVIDTNLFWGGGNGLKSIDLSNTKVTTIGNSAFDGCGLESIKLPSTLKTIGERVFNGCDRLKSIDFSGTQLTSIGDRAFQHCKNLITLKFPNSLTNIGEGMCWYCDNLEEINLENTKVSVISDYAFTGCDKVDVIRLPDTLKSIGKCSFSMGDSKLDGYTLVCSKFSENELYDMGYVKEGESPWYPSFYERKLYVTTKLYTIKYNANGGALVGSSTDYAGKGVKIRTLSSAKRSGYVFNGWYTAKKGGKKITSGSKLSKNTTLYAQWIKRPGKVTGIKHKVSSKKVTLSWNKVTGADGYEIYMSLSKKGKYKKQSICSNAKIKYTKKQLKNGKIYYFKIRSFKLNSLGKKIYSKNYSSIYKVKVK